MVSVPALQDQDNKSQTIARKRNRLNTKWKEKNSGYNFVVIKAKEKKKKIGQRLLKDWKEYKRLQKQQPKKLRKINT